MSRSHLASTFAGLCLLFAARSADAQLVTVYSPVIAPAPVITTVARPVVPVPAPVYVTVGRPVVGPVVAPVAAPLASAPVVPVAYAVARPVVATTAVTPVPVVTRRYRPLLGGSVTRVRYHYRPVVVYGY